MKALKILYKLYNDKKTKGTQFPSNESIPSITTEKNPENLRQLNIEFVSIC